MQKILFPRLLNVCLLIIAFLAPAALAQESYKLITFGKDAPKTEGDDNNYQVIFFSVPATVHDTLFLRLFDADCGGAHDQKIGEWNTTTSFALFGGQEAYNSELQKNMYPSRDVLYGGVKIHEEKYGINPLIDNEWVTHSKFVVAQGALIDGNYVFKLVITGETGDDGNAFDVFVSSSAAKNDPVAGVQFFSYSPTIRVDKRHADPEVRFRTFSNPNIELGNYDAASAPIYLETPVRSKISLLSSTDGNWLATSIQLNEFELNNTCALVIGKGQEMPNDITLFARETGGQYLPILLPIKPVVPNIRPDLKKSFSILADCFSVVFDGTQSRDRDNNELSFIWNFGDGTKASGSRVTHIYKEKKNYRASVMVTDNSGAVGNSSYEIFDVPVNKEPIPAMDYKNIVAPGEVVIFSGAKSIDPDGTIKNYSWDFGDGITAQGMDVKHIYEKPATYTVSLKTTDNSLSPCNNSTVTGKIWVNQQPKAITGKDIWVSPGQPVDFDGSASTDADGKIIRYSWNYGDNSTGEGQKTSHTYTAPGFYKVVLTVEDDARVSNSRAEDNFIVKVNYKPVSIAGPDQIVSPGETVYFDGKGSSDKDGFITAYDWDFGDGTTAAGVSVSHPYEKPGTYIVTLKVTDNSATSTGTAISQLKITVNKQPYVSLGPDIHVTKSTVEFDGSKSGDDDGKITKYEWSFGDGATSSERDPVHTYRKAGVFTVRLKVIDNTSTRNNWAEAFQKVIINAKPVAVAGKDQVGAPGQILSFTARESFDPDGTINQFQWDLGDGTTSTGRDITHSYAKPGVYKVRLKVADNSSQADAVDYDEFKVTVNQKPVAIAGSDIIVIPAQSFTLDGSKSYDADCVIKKYEWEFFPVGGSYSGKTVTHNFQSPGVYYAVLTVTDNSGALNATATDTVKIKVNSQPTSVPGDNVYTCNMQITFDGSKSTDADGDPLTYTWNFGDNSPLEKGVQVVHTYKKGGSYPVLLTVDDGMNMPNSSNTSAMKVVINEPPKADAGKDQVVCAGETVRFDGSASKDPEGGSLKYTWDLGDSVVAEGVNPTKIYKRGGTYTIRLKVEDDSGLPCNTSYDTKVVVVSESPVAVAGPDITACANSVIQFDGSKSRNYDGVVRNYSWDFGDGSLGGGAMPTHAYTKAGIYRVTLTITGDVVGECSNTDSDELVVTIIDAPKADFVVPQNFPVDKSLELTALPTVSTGINVTEYRWDFGDGTTASGKTVHKVYSKYGNYFISLLIKTDAKTDCHSASVRKLIIINQPPVAKIMAPNVTGLNQPVLFDASK
ncbi:MAG: PKD domain-containing protein, partial [Ignavibacteria bacterium]|nr:PKD domain-containing protein [Ignavibacteria bacterium]